MGCVECAEHYDCAESRVVVAQQLRAHKAEVEHIGVGNVVKRERPLDALVEGSVARRDEAGEHLDGVIVARRCHEGGRHPTEHNVEVKRTVHVVVFAVRAHGEQRGVKRGTHRLRGHCDALCRVAGAEATPSDELEPLAAACSGHSLGVLRGGGAEEDADGVEHEGFCYQPDGAPFLDNNLNSVRKHTVDGKTHLLPRVARSVSGRSCFAHPRDDPHRGLHHHVPRQRVLYRPVLFLRLIRAGLDPHKSGRADGERQTPQRTSGTFHKIENGVRLQFNETRDPVEVNRKNNVVAEKWRPQ
eukprot:PhM_4_TR6949/c0_g1_i1/m.76454